MDITPDIRSLLEKTGVQQGQVNIISRHTTTAVTINEAEPRLMDDARLFLRKLAPPDAPYLHNDLHLRGAPDWPGGWEAWAAQEPENCHSHLLSMLLGNSETVPVVDGSSRWARGRASCWWNWTGRGSVLWGCRLWGSVPELDDLNRCDYTDRLHIS